MSPRATTQCSVVLLALAGALGGCGRVGYASHTGTDAAPDVSPDAPEDAEVADDADASAPADASDAGPPDASLTEVSIEDFSLAVARVLCEAREPCYGAVASEDVSVEDCASILANQFLSTTIAQLRDAERAGRFTYDPSFAGACLAAIPIDVCEYLMSGYPEVCRNAMQGNVARGDACDFDVECGFDDVCEPSGAPSCPGGVCVPRQDVGGPCGRMTGPLNSRCLPGLRCVEGDRCALPIAAGDDCAHPNACASRLVCSGLTAQRCVAVPDAYVAPLGAPCDPARGVGCAPGLSCGGSPLVCHASAAAGETCAPGTPDPCPARHACDPASRRCVALPGEGMSCNRSWPVPCDPPLLCSPADTCRRLTPTGLECGGPADCLSGSCVAGLCEPLPICG